LSNIWSQMGGNWHKLIILTGLFTAAITCANTLAAKIFMVGSVTMTAGILAYPITFLVTDIVGDVWGKRYAQVVVLTGLMANVVMVALYQIGILLPPASFWSSQTEFATILGAVPRIVLASMVAYLISQAWDVWVFHKIKELWGPHNLWLRNNASTFTSQIIDSAVFLALAFWGVMPSEVLWRMFIVYVLVKWAIALIDTPLCYLGVAWARRGIYDEF